jgi:hypothetical protein
MAASLGARVLKGSSVRKPVRERGRWKGASVQRGLQHGSGGLIIVGAVTKQLLVKTLQAGKDLA